MATVDFFTGFTYKWAQTGNTFAWDDAQYKLGWATVGDTPPTVEQFNRVHQIADEKSNWLYGQLKTVADAKSVTLSAGSLTGLQQVLAAYGQSSTTDATLGRWMQVGAFGLGSIAPFSSGDYGYADDFNQMDGRTSWVSISGSIANGPAGAGVLPYVGVLLISVRNGSSTLSIKQEYSGNPSSVNGKGTWVRYGSGGPGARTWTAWEEVYTSRSIPAASTSVAGISRIATTAEAQAMTDDGAALTAKKLADALKGANQSLASPGYQKLPGGLIVQFGGGNTSEGGGIAVALPIAFPNFGITAVGMANTTAVQDVKISGNVSKTHATFFAAGSGGVGISIGVYWIAIGY